MAGTVEYSSSNALLMRCQAILAAGKPDSALMRRCAEDYRIIIEQDHVDMLLRVVDRHGSPRAPLAESTLKQKNRGPGPSLVPQFQGSRILANCQVLWKVQEAVMTVVKQFLDVVSKSGHPFLRYHLDGATRPGTRWVLPRRDVGGVTPAGFAQLKMRFAKFVQDLARYEKGRS